MCSNKDSNQDTNFERWKHFDSIAGSDKDRMVTIVNWLLGFALAILGYIAKENFNFGTLCFTDSKEALIFSFAGIIICVNAFYLVSAFGAYANHNWYNADLYAQNIYDLEGPHLKGRLKKPINYNRCGKKWCIVTRYYKKVSKLSCRHEPQKGLAPIFLWYLRISFIFLVLFIVLYLLALFQSKISLWLLILLTIVLLIVLLCGWQSI